MCHSVGRRVLKGSSSHNQEGRKGAGRDYAARAGAREPEPSDKRSPPGPVPENVSENRLPAQTGDVTPARLRWARSLLPLQLNSSEYRTFESLSPAIILTSVSVFECADSSFLCRLYAGR